MSQMIEHVDPKQINIQDVPRHTWSRQIIRKSSFDFISNIFRVEGTFALLVLMLFVLAILANAVLNSLALASVLMLLALFTLIANILFGYYLFQKTKHVTYELETGRYKVQDKIVDVIPAQVILNKGYFSRKVETYSISLFDNVSYVQGPIAKFFNAGSIILSKKDHTGDVRLRNVVEPAKYTSIIQELISDEGGFMVVRS